MTGQSKKHETFDERDLHNSSTFESISNRLQLVQTEFMGKSY